LPGRVVWESNDILTVVNDYFIIIENYCMDASVKCEFELGAASFADALPYKILIRTETRSATLVAKQHDIGDFLGCPHHLHR
jgi:hypothetical protein